METIVEQSGIPHTHHFKNVGLLDSATTDTAGTPDQPAQSMVADLQSTRGWWQFWKKS